MAKQTACYSTVSVIFTKSYYIFYSENKILQFGFLFVRMKLN